MVCFGGGGLSYWMGDRRLGGSLVVAAVTMKPKARTSFSFLADHEIAFPSCKHSFEEKHRRRHLNHHLPEVTGTRRLPSLFHLCGCSLVIEGEPSERRKLCDQGQRNILALVLHKDSSRAVSSLCVPKNFADS